ncbi:hypothetical protein CGRA01v4_00741 [Colletotrichum graminicola]|nr:hypothetical protein CGRA01v4_00741 [Colletotrichum graminicola]
MLLLLLLLLWLLLCLDSRIPSNATNYWTSTNVSAVSVAGALNGTGLEHCGSLMTTTL